MFICVSGRQQLQEQQPLPEQQLLLEQQLLPGKS